MMVGCAVLRFVAGWGVGTAVGARVVIAAQIGLPARTGLDALLVLRGSKYAFPSSAMKHPEGHVLAHDVAAAHVVVTVHVTRSPRS